MQLPSCNTGLDELITNDNRDQYFAVLFLAFSKLIQTLFESLRKDYFVFGMQQTYLANTVFNEELANIFCDLIPYPVKYACASHK